MFFRKKLDSVGSQCPDCAVTNTITTSTLQTRKLDDIIVLSCCHEFCNWFLFFLGGTRTLFKLPTLQKPFLISFFFYYLFLLHTANVCSVANSPRQIKRKSKHFVTNNERFIAKLTNLRCVHWIIYLSTVLHQTICFRRKMRRRLMSTSVILLKIIHFPAKCES
jgi:hypothetical protein